MPSRPRAFMAWSRRSRLQKRSGSAARVNADGDRGVSIMAISPRRGPSWPEGHVFCRRIGIKPGTRGRCNGRQPSFSARHEARPVPPMRGSRTHTGGEVMRTRSSFVITIAAVAASAIAVQVRAGGDKIAFPENFAQGVMYTNLDRADNKQYRELFVTPAAIEAAKKGEPLPSGTVITIVQYKAQLDAQGNPVKAPNGRFVKGELISYGV